MNSPQVSVIIPTLNSVRFIGEAIESALKQSEPVLEILVVDGGSRDGTVEAVKKINGPVRVLAQEGRGRPGARNTGLRQAKGKYIGLLDSDDLWTAGKLEAQLDFLKQNPSIDMVFGDMSLFSKPNDPDVPEVLDGSVHDYLRQNCANLDRFMECLFKVNFIPTSSVLFRTSCLQTVGYMNEKFLHCEDFEYWLRFAAQSKVGFIDRVLVRRRMHDANAMNEAYVQNCEATLAILKYWSEVNNLPQKVNEVLSRRRVQVQYNLSSYLLKSGRAKEAYHLLCGIQTVPGQTDKSLRLRVGVKKVFAGFQGLFAKS